jgi:hypothetical protein
MNEPIHTFEMTVNIYDALPKFVTPEYTIFEDRKGFRVCLKDMRDNYSFDCQVFIFDEIITHEKLKTTVWSKYFFMLFAEGVL